MKIIAELKIRTFALSHYRLVPSSAIVWGVKLMEN